MVALPQNLCVNLLAQQGFMKLILADALARNDGHFFGTNEAIIAPALRRIALEIRELRKPALIRAFQRYGNGFYLTDGEYTPPWKVEDNTATHAFYTSETHCTELALYGRIEFKEGSIAFLGPYGQFSTQDKHLSGIFGDARACFRRNIFTHEMAHWLDYSINNYGWQNSGEDSHSPARHTASELYRIMDVCDRNLSQDTSLNALNHHEIRAITAYKRRSYSQERFSQFAEVYFCEDQLTSYSPIVALYFYRVLEYQLGIMDHPNMGEEEKHLRLTALGKILGYGYEKTTKEIIGETETDKLIALVQKGRELKQDGIIESSEIHKLNQQALYILEKALDRVMKLAEQEYHAILDGKSAKAAFRNYYIVEALRESLAYSKDGLSGTGH